ncbi:MAG: YajQ family cyclic di-GMP-binding protein [Gammaproteobacteria bacterium]|nr:YajQ family cyclic di-GMP-binding protein [Gammaproteobacteria bacterium]MCI0591156.1 YajQ family cyclic di-GMP-binding protein [Gammaproteobacteria bacterium]
MASFDVVSRVDLHELTNAVDQTNREVSNRFDFKGTNARVEQVGHELTLRAEVEFQINQIREILAAKMARRGIDLGCLEFRKVVVTGSEARQMATARHGIDVDLARKIVKLVKESELKVQATIQGEQVRVSGKKRDDLQQVIATLQGANLGLPLQFVNYRD